MESKALNIDCMLGMSEYPDKYFELAIVDPPYGENCEIKEQGNRKTSNGFSEVWLSRKHNEWNNAPTENYFAELFRVSKNQIIWGGNYFPLPLTSSWAIWDKMQRDFSFADGEMAWSSFGKAMRIFSLSRGEMQQETRIHPTQKPVKLYKWLLDKYAKQGDKILDTHLGSGSSRIACYDYGFDFTGFELDKDYFEAQEKRFKDHISQTNLFKVA